LRLITTRKFLVSYISCLAFDLPPPEKRTSIVVKKKQRMVEHRKDEAIIKKVSDITKLDR